MRYLGPLRRAGAQEAVLLPVPIGRSDAGDLLARFDGLMLIGGGDVDPSRYGEPRSAETYGVDADTDTFELNLVSAALERELPTLAICRGIQVLNVALGGTLIQHITGREGLLDHGIPGAGDGGAHHEVRLEPGSRIAKAMGTETADCASHHHQAIARLSESLVATGWSEDGVIEAVEAESGWVLGVQWHPEDTAADDPSQQGLFDALVEEAAGR